MPRIGAHMSIAGGLSLAVDRAAAQGYRATFDAFDRIVGLKRLKVLHVNDSKKPCGSRIDRHEHIGDGTLGLEPFRRLLHDPWLADVPMVLETPKSADRARSPLEIDPLDARNLRTLRELRERP